MLTRIITGLVGAAAAVLLITRGHEAFSLAVMALAMLGWQEYRRMAANKNVSVYYLTSGVGALLLPALAAAAYYFNIEALYTMAFLTMTTALFVIFSAAEALYRHCRCGEADWARQAAANVWGMAYTGLLLAHVILLRSMDGPRLDMGFHIFEYGEACLWTVLLGTWASDTFAYFVGRACGRRPFCSVSPKKSLEGAAGGFIGCVLVTAACGIIGLGIPLWQALTVALGVAVFAPLGDLVESVLKRTFEVKDSGSLLPGHGGVLDRFDSLLFTAPVAYYLFMIMSIVDYFITD